MTVQSLVLSMGVVLQRAAFLEETVQALREGSWVADPLAPVVGPCSGCGALHDAGGRCEWCRRYPHRPCALAGRSAIAASPQLRADAPAFATAGLLVAVPPPGLEVSGDLSDATSAGTPRRRSCRSRAACRPRSPVASDDDNGESGVSSTMTVCEACGFPMMCGVEGRICHVAGHRHCFR
jgi:hypothetical protein